MAASVSATAVDSRLLVCLSVLTLLFCGSPGKAQELPDTATLLLRYHRAIQALPTPTRYGYTQRIETYGWQEGITTGEFGFAEAGSWSAQLIEGDRLYRLDAKRLRPVSEGDRLGMYTEYIEHPEGLAPTAYLDLDATPEHYSTGPVEQARLGEASLWHLPLTPRDGGPLRELWLDPASALPRRAVLFLAGVWGTAKVTLDFRAYESYWLPERQRTEIQMDFWVPVGLSRRVFAGRIDVGGSFSAYHFGNRAENPAFPTPIANQTIPLADRPVQPTRPSKTLGKSLEVGISTQSTSSVLADRIAQFNLSKPDLIDPRTRLNIFYDLRLGSSHLILYLFRFDAKQPLVPLEPANTQGDSFKLFGTN